MQYIGLLMLMLSSIVLAQVNLAADPTNQISRLWIQGLTGVNRNDQETSVQCPDGHYVSDCYCADETTCDGTRIMKDKKTCAAYHKGHSSYRVKTPTKPVVRCKPKEGRNVRVVRYYGPSMKSSATCLPGYVMENCVVHNPFAERYNAHIVWSLNEEGQVTCAWKQGQDITALKLRNQPSDVTAVCVKYNI